MAPEGESGAGLPDLGEDAGSKTMEGLGSGLGKGGSSYVPPHLRGGAAAGGERMGGKYERDDLATLRVTNVSLSPSSSLGCIAFSPYTNTPPSHRSPNSQKKTSSALSSNASAASPVSSSPKTEKPAEQRVSLSCLLSTVPMLR